jgi:dephospho-CoA kinase
MVFVVGLTGGIGSGKSIVADYFSALKVPVIDADKVSHELCKPTQLAFTKIRERFGDFILDSDGNLDREKIRRIIFRDLEEKVWLEGVLHPLIIKVILDWCRNLKATYCIVVAPLLLETSMKNDVDRVLVVDCSKKNQVQRVSARDKIQKAEVELILSQQLSREARLKLADDVIVNDDDLEVLRKKVMILHDFYTSYVRG